MAKIMKNEFLPAIDQCSSRQEWEKICWQRILKSKSLFDSLITPYERHNLIIRAAAIDRMNSGRSYRQISEELWLSSQTISVIKKAQKESNYRSYRQRGKTERKKRKYGSLSGYAKKTKKSIPIGRAVRTKYGTLFIK